MVFHEKFDFLMKLTNTTNSKLARFVSLDPSFVSRLRKGSRHPAKNENYVKSIALFLAKQISEEHQKTALSNAWKIPLRNIPGDTDALAELIHKWFFGLFVQNLDTLEGFLDTLAHSRPQKTAPKGKIDLESYPQAHKIDTSVFYGIAGKQNAALKFLSLVEQSPGPQTLLLFSDEDIEWLTSNRDFIARWSMLLMQVAAKGSRIKIIHTVGRDLPEMLSAIKQWLPLYMTGAIEPYFYPRKRDGVFQKTLFIAPDTAAVLSGSVGRKIVNTATFLFNDRKTILSLADEFYNLFSLCRPLMKIFTAANKEEFTATLEEFEGEDADTLLVGDTLSALTMPLEVFKSILGRTKTGPKSPLNQEFRLKKFEDNLRRHSFTKAVKIPDLEEVRRGKVRIAFSDMLGETELFYTVKEYAAHLENIIRLLEEYNNFHVTLKSDDNVSGFMLYIKENVGVLVAKNAPPTIMFAINESNLTAAFWDYIEPLVKNYKNLLPDKRSIIAKLNEAIQKLKH